MRGGALLLLSFALCSLKADIALASEQLDIQGYKDINLGSSWQELRVSRSFLETSKPTEYQLEGFERLELSDDVFSFTMKIRINADSVESIVLHTSSGQPWWPNGEEQQMGVEDVVALRDRLLNVLRNKYPKASHSRTTTDSTKPGKRHAISGKRKPPVKVGAIETDSFRGTSGNMIELSAILVEQTKEKSSALIDLGGYQIPASAELEIRYLHKPEITTAEESL